MQKTFWLKSILLPLAAFTIIGCTPAENSPAAQDCNADDLQFLVGMSGIDAYTKMEEQPVSVTGSVEYAGTTTNLEDVPKGTLIIEHSSYSVADAIKPGSTVRRVYCKS